MYLLPPQKPAQEAGVRYLAECCTNSFGCWWLSIDRIYFINLWLDISLDWCWWWDLAATVLPLQHGAALGDLVLDIQGYIFQQSLGDWTYLHQTVGEAKAVFPLNTTQKRTYEPIPNEPAPNEVGSSRIWGMKLSAGWLGLDSWLDHSQYHFQR